MIDRLYRFLAQPIHPASLAAFRIGYGIVIAWMMFDHLRPQSVGPTWIRQLFDATPEPFYFSYPGLDWCKPLPVEWMEAIAWISVISSLSLAIGLFTRASAWISFLTMAYVMTSDAHLYGNHIALALVYSFLLVWMPSGATLSVDAWLSRNTTSSPTIPFLSLFLLRVQTFLIYFFGGVAKIHPDWLAGEPMQSWFRGGTTAQMIRELLGPGLADHLIIPLFVKHETALFFSYGGLVFDLTVGLLLLCRRTRLFALALATFFHAFNFFFVHNVGLVAVMAFWATLVFCEPDWPIQLFRWIKEPKWPNPDLPWFLTGMVLFPVLGAFLGWKSQPSGWSSGSLPLRRIAIAGSVLWITLATLVPLRHFIIAGDVLFTAEGTAFSWFLMTCNKEGEFLRFEVIPPEPVSLDSSPWTMVDIAATPQWTQADQLLLTFEPPFGHRLFVRHTNPKARIDFINQWRKTYGRSPSLEPTIPISDLFTTLQNSTPSVSSPPLAEPVIARVRHAESIYRQMQDSATDPARQRTLYDLLLYQIRLLVSDLVNNPAALALLIHSRPFELFPHTSTSTDSNWMLVIDPALFQPGQGKVLSMIDPSAWRGSKQVHCYVDYLTHPYLALFEPIIPIERHGRIESYWWNDTAELNDHQVQALGYFPYLLRQYARHVAKRWQDRFGKRPQIHVNSYLWLNHHDFQPLVDPSRNLDDTTYHYLSHNDWILDYQRKSPPR
jgi:hypothetical protein